MGAAAVVGWGEWLWEVGRALAIFFLFGGELNNEKIYIKEIQEYVYPTFYFTLVIEITLLILSYHMCYECIILC